MAASKRSPKAKKAGEKRWRLVIDTSIFRAASERPSADPRGQTCSDLLHRILTICHHVAFAPEARDEWNRHRSRFAMTWRRAMTARKKLHFLEEACRDDELRDVCRQLFEDDDAPGSWDEVEKDLHLVEAALVTDKVVLSVDRRIHECLAWVASQRGARSLQGLRWLDPVEDEGKVGRLLAGSLPRGCRLGS